MKVLAILPGLILSIITIPGFTSYSGSKASPQKQNRAETIYQCTPCGYDCDSTTYTHPGECPGCHMPLVEKSSIIFKSIDPSAICEYVSKHLNAVLLDVRTKEEFEGKASPNFGTLKNAINIPVQELKNRLPELSYLKDKEIIVYCSHSHRSPQASYLLTNNGFKKVTNMNGGMSVVSDSTCKK